MSSEPRSSDSVGVFPADSADDLQLAVLVAVHQRGELTAAEIGQLVTSGGDLGCLLAHLIALGNLELRGTRYVITQPGREFLDRVLEAIQSQLTPDDPAYERRFRREQPSLPFEANTVWAEAVSVNIRIHPEALRPLIPPQFELDLHDGWAFISLTASRLKDFGMGRVPNAVRMNFYQATYRAHVVFTDFRGRRLRGCYFVRSETNSRVMSLTANLLPEFKAHHCSTYPMLMARQQDHFLLSVDSGADPAGKVVLVLDTSRPLSAMPARSIFATIPAAYDYIVDFHDAFSYDPVTGDVLILRIERGEWEIQVFDPVDCYLGYVSAGPLPLGAAELDSVFYFRNTPYRWLPLLKERMANGNR